MFDGNPRHRSCLAPNGEETQRRFEGNIPVKGTEVVNAADRMTDCRVHAKKNPLQGVDRHRESSCRDDEWLA